MKKKKKTLSKRVKELEKRIQKLEEKVEKIKSDYRCFLTANSSDSFALYSK